MFAGCIISVADVGLVLCFNVICWFVWLVLHW